jgi:hypothetical protein
MLFAVITHILFGCYSEPKIQIAAAVSSEKQSLSIRRIDMEDKLAGFWLGQNIANWTGLITEMDKVKAPFYTDDDWGKPDEVAIWGEFVPHSNIIDFYFVPANEPWGADDDTDMEYMYQHLMLKHQVSILTPEQIQQGWLKHIYSESDAPLYKKFPDSKPVKENFLWVSNERALELMQQGMLPPATSEPENNDKYMMIDAQLTTEIFGLFAPGRPDIALKLAHLPIRVAAKDDAEYAAQFYVVMYSLAANVDNTMPIKAQVELIADQARLYIPNDSYMADMYDYVKQHYTNNPDKSNWESTRNAVYLRYQIQGAAGYQYQDAFDAGINFAASIISLFYGQSDLANTIKIGSLAGWDSDNPTATWGGLLGYILGEKGVKQVFKNTILSDSYSIHRTRRNFPDYTPNEPGEATFGILAKQGAEIVERVVKEQINGQYDALNEVYIIPRL